MPVTPLSASGDRNATGNLPEAGGTGLLREDDGVPLVSSPRVLRRLWWVLVAVAAAVFVASLSQGEWLPVVLSGLALAELIREARTRWRQERGAAGDADGEDGGE